MRPETLGERWSDAPDAIESGEGTERSVALTVLDDPRRERRTDAG